MNWKVTNALAAALFLACAGTAQAVTTTFVFTGRDSTNPASLPFDFMLSDGALDLTVSGHSLGSGRANRRNIITHGTVKNEKIGRYGGGLGIVTAHDDDHQVDGRNSFGGDTEEIDEFVKFAFNREVEIKAIDFSFVGGNDDFRWLLDTNGDGHLGVGDWISPQTDIPGSTIYSLLSTTHTNVFGVGAFRYNDEWKLKNITIDYALQPVPLPAALPLFAGGLGVMALLGWRRKRLAARS